MSQFTSVELVFHAEPAALTEAFEQAHVLARIDYLPASVRAIAGDGAVFITAGILVDEAERIVTVTDAGVAVGPQARDLVGAIANRLEVSLWVPKWDLEVEPASYDPAPGARDTATDNGLKGEKATIVVVTPAPMSAMPMYATAVQQDLSVLDLGDRRVVMSTSSDEPVGFGHFGWSEDTLPSLVLLNDFGERTVALHETEANFAEGLHSWDLVTEFVTGSVATPGPGAQALIDEFFSATRDAEAFASYAGVSPDRMYAAMTKPGDRGMLEMIALFNLPGVVAKVLDEAIEPADVPGAQTFTHESWRGAIKETTRLYMAEQFPEGTAGEFWTQFGHATFDNPRMRLALAGAGGLIGGLLLRSAIKSGGKVRGTFGALFIVDAIGNAVLTPLIEKWKREGRTDLGLSDDGRLEVRRFDAGRSDNAPR